MLKLLTLLLFNVLWTKCSLNILVSLQHIVAILAILCCSETNLASNSINKNRKKLTMDNIMLGEALGAVLRPLKNIIDQLLTDKRELWTDILKLMSRIRPGIILMLLRRKPNLEFCGKVKVPRIRQATFPVREEFKHKTEGGYYNSIDPNLFVHFGSRTILAVGERPVNHYDVLEEMTDGEIFSDLGGIERVKTSLMDIAFHVRQHRNSVWELKDVLLTDGRSNDFYVCDDIGTVRVISLIFTEQGLNLMVGCINEYPTGRIRGRVFTLA